MRTLVIAEHDGLTLNDTFFKTLSAASQLKAEVDVIVFGFQCDQVINQVKNLKDVSNVYRADDVNLQHQPEDCISRILRDLIKNYTHLVCSSSCFGKSVLPRVSAYLGVAHISAVTAIISDEVFVRPIYAGRLISTVKSHDPVKVMTVLASAFPASSAAKNGNDEASPVVDVSLNSDILPSSMKFVSEKRSKFQRKSLESAAVVVSAGRGLNSQKNVDALEILATKLDAAVGGTRAVIDAGWMSHDRQIGQTAKIVAPDLYIALGISGAAQHIAGMKNSKIIIAVNRDSNAPIFELANYGFIGDLNEVMPQLNLLL